MKKNTEELNRATKKIESKRKQLINISCDLAEMGELKKACQLERIIFKVEAFQNKL